MNKVIKIVTAIMTIQNNKIIWNIIKLINKYKRELILKNNTKLINKLNIYSLKWKWECSFFIISKYYEIFN